MLARREARAEQHSEQRAHAASLLPQSHRDQRQVLLTTFDSLRVTCGVMQCCARGVLPTLAKYIIILSIFTPRIIPHVLLAPS